MAYPHQQQPPPRQPLNIQRRPSPRKNRDTSPPKPPSRSSSFSFSNRTSFSSIDSAFHTPRASPPESQSKSDSSGTGIYNLTTTTTTIGNQQQEQEQLTFICTFCWQPYPLSSQQIFHTTPTTSVSRRHRKRAATPRAACNPCYRAIIDLSIYWVCGEVVLRGEECVSLGWCFWHRACYGCLLCGSRRVVRPDLSLPEIYGEEREGDGKGRNYGGKGVVERERQREREMRRDREREMEKERQMLGRKRGWEIDQVPLCKGCLDEVEGKAGKGPGKGNEEKDMEKEVVRRGLERIDKVEGGLTRRRWEMREGERKSEMEREKKKIEHPGKGDLLPTRRGAVDDRSLTRDEMVLSSGSDKAETIYVNIFDPVGREAFRPSLMKSIPKWMHLGAREHLDRKVVSSSAVDSSRMKPRKQMTENTSTNSTPRPVSQDSLSPGISESSSTATVIQTPQPTPARTPTRRRSGAISPRATSPAPSIAAISRPSSVLGRRTPNLRTGTSFVSEQQLVVPSMSSTHPKETTKGPAKDPTRDSWLSTDSNLSSSPPTAPQPEFSSRPSSVRSFATLFERGIASKDQRHTPVNQPLPLLRVLQQPYRPLTPTLSNTSLSSSSHLQPNNLATRPQRAQTHELGAASLPKPIQILRSGQAGQSSMNRMGSATVSIPVVSTSSEYLERYQPVKASTTFLSSSSPPQSARTSVHTSIRAGGPGVSAIARGWEGQLSNNTSSGETERDLASNRFSAVCSTSQPLSSYLQSSYPAEAERSSIRRSVSHSIRREGALDEGVRGGPVSDQGDAYRGAQGQTTIRRSISHSVRREGGHDQRHGQHFTQPQPPPQSPKPQSPTIATRILQYSPPTSLPSSPPNNHHGNSNGPASPIPLNFTVQRRFVKRNNSKGGPTVGSIVTAPSVSTTGTDGRTPPPSSSESSPTTGIGTGTATAEEKGGGSSSFRPAWSRTRTSSTGNNTMSGTSTPLMPPPVAVGTGQVKTLSKRRSVHAELKRLFGR